MKKVDIDKELIIAFVKINEAVKIVSNLKETVTKRLDCDQKQIDLNTKRLDSIDNIFRSMHELNKLNEKVIRINKKSDFFLIHFMPFVMMMISTYLVYSYDGNEKKIMTMLHLIVCCIFMLVPFFHYNRRDKNVPRGTKGEK